MTKETKTWSLARILVLALSVCLVFAMFAVGASAADPNYVAQIFDPTPGVEDYVKYETLQAAVDAAEEGDVIELIKSASGDGVVIDKSLTIDLRGNTYTVDGELVGSAGTETLGFQLRMGDVDDINNITIKDGTITSDIAKMLVQNYSNLTLDNVTLTGGDVTRYVLSNNNGKTVLTGRTKVSAAAGMVAVAACRFADYPSVKVTIEDAIIAGNLKVSGDVGEDQSCELHINGGTIYGELIMAYDEEDLVGSVVTKADSVKLDAPEHYKWVDGVLTHKAYGVCNASTGKKYETLPEAVKDAGDYDVIVLDKDLSGDGVVIDKNLSINLNNHTYTITGKLVGPETEEVNGFVLADGKENGPYDVFIYNGDITGDKEEVLVQSYANLTLTNVNLTGGTGNKCVLSLNNGSVDLSDDTTIQAAKDKVAMAITRSGNYPSVSVTINKANVAGDIKVSGSVDAEKGQSCELSIENALVNGKLIVDCKGAYVYKDNKVVLDAPAPYFWLNGVLSTIGHLGNSLSLEGLVYINHYATFTGFTDDDYSDGDYIEKNGGLLIWKTKPAEADATFAKAEIKQEGLTWDEDMKAYHQQTAGIPAKEFADELYLRTYVKLDNGQYAYGALKEYSVQAYCESRIKNSSNEKMKALAAATLHYGASAQTYFKYHTDDLANKNITIPVDKWNADLLDDVVAHTIAPKEPATNDVKVVGQSLSLEGTVLVNYYFNPADGQTWRVAGGELQVWDGTTNLRDNSDECYYTDTMTYDTEKQAWHGQSVGFVAKEYSKTIYARAKFTDGAGKVHYSKVITYNPETYAKGRITNSTNADMVELAKRLVMYGERARLYFLQ